MIKKVICSILLPGFFFYGFSQTTLNAGDIAITGFNCDQTGGFRNIINEFTFVLLKDIENGTTIKFTDNGWLSSGSFRANEGVIEWEANSDLSCGTEININTGIFNFFFFTFPFYNTSTGLLNTSNFANFDLSTTGDQILAYQGPNTTPNFIFAINFNGNNWQGNANNNANSAIPIGLTNNTNALHINEIDNAEYNCNNISGTSNILNGITNPSNWLRNNTTRFSPLGGCSFSCDNCSLVAIWNGTWSATPNLTTEVIFNTDYTTSLGSLEVCALTINAGATLTVENGTFIIVENDVTINGDLIVETQGNFIQNDNSGIITGTATLNKTTPLKNEWFYYTYWSSPVVAETIGNVFPLVATDRRYSYNAANFVDNDLNEVDDNGDDWQIAAGTDTMIPGVGYAVTAVQGGTFPRTDDIQFTGTFNTGDITLPITYNPTNLGLRWNFIGNPYPSAIDFVAFHLANAAVLEGAAYFWSQALPPLASNPGNDVLNFSQNDYAVFNVGTGGIGARGDTGARPNGYVASAQGFFIPTLNTLTNPTQEVTFTNAIRSTVSGSNGQFFKSSGSKKSTVRVNNPLENRLWINLTSNNGVFNQILIGYVDNATDGYDGMSFDAPKLLNPGFAAVLYSNIDNDATKYVIQGKDINSINNEEVIKIGYHTTITAETQYKLAIGALEGDFLNSHSVYLNDNVLNIQHNLTDSDYTFTSEVGEFNSRFEIVFNEQSLSTDDFDTDRNTLRIIELYDDQVQFNISNNLTIKSVSIYDLLGRQLYNFKGNTSSETYKLSNLSNTAYIAKVELSNGAVITKKMIKK